MLAPSGKRHCAAPHCRFSNFRQPLNASANQRAYLREGVAATPKVFVWVRLTRALAAAAARRRRIGSGGRLLRPGRLLERQLAALHRLDDVEHAVGEQAVHGDVVGFGAVRRLVETQEQVLQEGILALETDAALASLSLYRRVGVPKVISVKWGYV